MSEDYLYVRGLHVCRRITCISIVGKFYCFKRSHIVKFIHGIVWSDFYPYSSEIDYSIIKRGHVYYLEKGNNMIVAVL